MLHHVPVRLTQLMFGIMLLFFGTQAFAQCTGNLTTQALFTQTNVDGIGTNEAVAYYRGTDGSLCEAGRYATGGSGSAAAKLNGGQNGVLLAGNCLLVTNAGPSSLLNINGSVSSFRIGPNALSFAGKVPSRGLLPVSVTVHGNNGYVVNDLSNSINGFSFNPGTCAIAERPNSHRMLKDPSLGVLGALSALGNPAQIEYTPNGKFLIVTNRQLPDAGLLPYAIHVLTVGSNGLTGADTITSADGLVPFGFDFDKAGHLLVSNAGEPFVGLSSLTSYNVNTDGTLSVLGGGPAYSGQSGACWVAYTTHTDQPIAYVMSLIGSVISSYTVNDDGSLTLLDGAAAIASNPLFLLGLDITLSEVGPNDTDQYLYAINTTAKGFGGIVTYRVENNGRLTQLGPVMTGPSQGSVGLAVR